MKKARLRFLAMIVIAALCFTFLPAPTPARADSTPTKTWLLALTVGLMAGFASYMFWSILHEGGISEREFDEERRETYVREHRELDPVLAQVILRGDLVRFMEPDQVYASWGRPDEIQQQEGSENAHWIWRKGENRILHAYFLNGKLDNWRVERPKDEE